MKNEHIEEVKKWLKKPESFNQERLTFNDDAAQFAALASFAAKTGDADDARHWVEEHERLSQ